MGVVIRNYEGKIFEYPEAEDGTPLVDAPNEIEEPELCKRGESEGLRGCANNAKHLGYKWSSYVSERPVSAPRWKVQPRTN